MQNFLYENKRADQEDEVTLPDYINVKGRYKRTRGKESRPTPNSLEEVVVHDTKTKDGKFNFLIYDNHKKNRILIFATLIKLKSLDRL